MGPTNGSDSPLRVAMGESLLYATSKLLRRGSRSLDHTVAVRDPSGPEAMAYREPRTHRSLDQPQRCEQGRGGRIDRGSAAPATPGLGHCDRRGCGSDHETSTAS